MSQKKDAIAVIGLGRFGYAVARSLAQSGQSVLALDANQKLVDLIAPQVEACACVDSTDAEALLELEIDSFSCVIIGIGDSAKEASILTTSLVASMNVPRIIARATDSLHERVLRSVGAHEVVNPEAEIGARLGRRLAHPNFLEELQLGDEATLVEIDVPPAWVGKTLLELDLRKRYEINVVAINTKGKVMANPAVDQVLAAGDSLIVIGALPAIRRLDRLP